MGDEAQLVREEIYAIKEVLKEMGNDNMEMAWTEFVDFFRRTNLLLEYQTHGNLNRTTLCAQVEEEERKYEEEQKEKKFTSRRPALTKTLTKMLKLNEEEDDDEDKTSTAEEK